MGVQSNTVGYPLFDKTQIAKIIKLSVPMLSDTLSNVTLANHGLGYSPSYICFISDGTYVYPTPAITSYTIDNANNKIRPNKYLYSYVDGVSVYVSATDALGAGNTTYTATFYLFKDTGSA